MLRTWTGLKRVYALLWLPSLVKMILLGVGESMIIAGEYLIMAGY